MDAKQIAEYQQSATMFNQQIVPQWRAMYVKCIEEGFTEEQSMRILLTYIKTLSGARE